MGLKAAHQYLATQILLGLSTTDPDAQIRRAYPFIPPARLSFIPDVPCALVTFETPEVSFRSALRIRPYTFHIQLLVASAMAEADIAAAKAAGLYDALIARLSDNLTLGGTVSHINTLRGQAPDTLTGLQWGEKAYVGLDLFLEATFAEGVTYSP